MMRHPNVTRDAVFAAADSIADAGMEPTQREILNRCGGSYSTVGPLLREWRAIRAAKAKIRPVVPDAMVDRLCVFGDELWAMAIEMTNRAMASERERLDRERAAMEEDRQQLLDLLAAMESTAQTHAAQIAELQQTIRSADATASELCAKLAAATERAAVAEARVHEIEKRADGLAQELGRLGTQNAALLRAVSRSGRKPALC